MPKVKARMRSYTIENGQLIAVLEFNEKVPRVGDIVTVKWGAVRSKSQNSLYWAYLTWLIDHGGLKDSGHFSPDALHLDLKAHFLSEKVMTHGQFRAIEETTTTTLTKSEFSEYIQKVDEFVRDFFSIDTSPFWGEHQTDDASACAEGDL